MENQPLILVLYVDDIFLTGEEILILERKREISLYFEMKDLCLMNYFLVLYIWNRDEEIFLSKGKYILDILCIFGMEYCKSINTLMDSKLRKIHETETRLDLVGPILYRQSIISFMYLIHSRKDIFYAVSILSQFMKGPRHKH